MIKPNKVGIFFIGLFILITGCENDPLELTHSNGQTLIRTVFTLGSESEAIQDSVIIGSSKTLYAGYFEDDKLSTILLSLDDENLQEHPICLYGSDSLNNIENIQIELKSLDSLLSLDTLLSLSELISNPDLYLFDEVALSIGLSSTDPWSEECDLTDPEFSNFIWNIDIPLQSISFTLNSLQISLSDASILEGWCESQDQYIIIEYNPVINEDKLRLLEFYSSEFTISHRPQVTFDYSKLMATEKSTNKFLIDSINSQLSESSVHIVNNIESEAWARIYLLNVDDVLESNLDSAIVTYDLSYNDNPPIIDSEMLNQEVEILKLTIALNDDIIDSIDTFGLSILDNSIISYSSSVDLSGDNYSTDILETEGNSIFDQGEEFLDFGFDQCPDQYEDGNNECLVLLSDFNSTEFNCIDSDDIEVDINCIYNTVGTEGNGVLDWEDSGEGEENSNGIWDDGEGEKWEDLGSDGCTDEFEDGEGACLEAQNEEYFEGSDPNNDNYIVDPNGDDWNEDGGTEGNGIWDNEQFFDIGCDGIPQIVDADGTQGNGAYDNCEPFNDTGIDGLYSYEEIGYNSSGSEGNAIYNTGESTDAGDEDGCLNQFEDGLGGCLDTENLDFIEGSDPNGDDYILDPNRDNEDGDGNGAIDWTDTIEDNLYNKDNEVGEYFYDFGSDGVIDADEVFSEVNFLNVGTGTDEGVNDYTIDKDMVAAITYPMPDLSTDDIMLWISKIDPTVGVNQFELTFSVYAEKEVKSISFSLTHTKSDWVEFVSESFSSNDYTAKFVDDISVYEINDFEDATQLTLNYGYGITSKIDFVNIDSSRIPIHISLGDFINENRNALLSNAYTQLVLPIDVENSTIDELGANFILSGIVLEESQPLISINISQNDERIIIPISTLLQKYLNGQYVNYNGFELALDGTKYNFSNIIFQNSAYLEIVYSK